MSTERIIRLAQDLLADDAPDTISPALIEQRVDEAAKAMPPWAVGLDRPKAIAELVRRFSLWIGSDATLSSDVGHVPWLNAARKNDWRYWSRYEQYLGAKMSSVAVRALDKTTDNILGHLEDPTREGPWDRRGLVVGHVQSGKTGNYTGLITKAADAGYKIIIVLAGMHNNLRAQTQIRLDEGFLGFETKPNRENLKPIGVGLIDSDLSIRPNYVTDRSDGGDFNTARARMGITPEQRPWLFVVKKNKTILERLLQWIRNNVADAKDTTGRRVVTRLPLLVIDDEADHASVDTGEQIFDGDGVPDPEHEPKTINRLVRSLLHTFQRSAYVGYTATPFANIFIHEGGETREEGPDLFPAAFIVSLATPSTYIGPAKVFGTRTQDGRSPYLDMFRTVERIDGDQAGTWIPDKHDKQHVPSCASGDLLPASLVKAVDSYVIACAVRQLRGQDAEHSSMLIHVTRFINVQNRVFKAVEEHVEDLLQRVKRRIGHTEVLQRMEQLWLQDFVPGAKEMRTQFPELFNGETIPTWADIESVLIEVLDDIEVRVINGSAKDALDYADQSGKGLKVIAVGGDKLSRGLTLEGLTTSYFLRSSKMYDTLMQMGRWFGYRPGYIDVCRLYSTEELWDWFSHIADAAEELRAEFDLMTQTGATPREFGLKVQSHPVLMVTSAVKMRSARNLMLSFSGQGVETVSLFSNKAALDKNMEALATLLTNISNKRREASKRKEWNGFIWDGVDAQHIVQFLGAYRTSPDALKVNSVLLAEFIRSMQATGELKSWTVALAGTGTGDNKVIIPGIAVDMMKRTAIDDTKGYSIGRLLSPPDEAVDLDKPLYDEALRITREIWAADTGNKRRAIKEPEIPSGPAIRRVRGLGVDGAGARPDTGLLLLYVLDPAKAGEHLKGLPPVVAFGMSFPASESGTKVPYKVNNVGWELDYAGG